MWPTGDDARDGLRLLVMAVAVLALWALALQALR